MSEAALLRVTNAQSALIAALDSCELEPLEAANARLADALAELQAEGAWRERAELRDALIRALKSCDAARARVNYLADANRRKLDRLVAIARGPATHAYGRRGRLV